ncbi:MAG: NDP-sugar synthase, partial [Alicyclobacillus sp.]|nr:NDP-sugar synthase [Alicyclobacillus sp.]
LLLAGGLGTRLRPLTDNLPKPMTPVVNRPWLEHLILHLRDQGITDFVMAVRHHAHRIRAHFGHGRQFGVQIQYVYESTPLGTAGAIKQAEDLLGDRFLVLNADVIHLVNVQALLKFHNRHGGMVTIGLTEVDDPSQYGVVRQTSHAEIIQFVEKPNRHEAPSRWINAGIYLMEKAALDWIPRGRETSIERETFPLLIQRCVGVYGLRMSGYWADMGTLARYLQVHDDVLRRRVALDIGVPLHRRGIWRGRAQLAVDVELVPPVVIGDGAVIEAGCTIGPGVVVGEGAVIGAGSTLNHCVVWPNTRVAPGTKAIHTVFGDDFQVTLDDARPVPHREVVLQYV